MTGGLPGPRCPTCGRPALRAFRPFCSGRCADVDLQRWLSGVYVIPAADEDQDAHGERARPAAPERDGTGEGGR